MTQLLILACMVIVTLAALLGYQAWIHAGNTLALTTQQDHERSEWAGERRMLIDRVIAKHAGEIVAFEQAEARKNHPSMHEAVRERPLLEGLS